MFTFTINVGGRAVAGAAILGIAVAISSLTVVQAQLSPDGSTRKVFSCTSGQACVEGLASGKNSFGVWGKSAAGTGVQGNSTATNNNSGVAGINGATTGTGYGVYGRSSNGPGVYGTSSAPYDSGIGVSGTGNSTGVQGEATYVGVEGINSTNGGLAVSAIGNNTGTFLFSAFDNANDASCIIDGSANLTCTGTIGGATIRPRHENGAGQQLLTYASESATATIEDVGTARMSGGVAIVRIDPSFASLMDHKWYYVFLTPLGDTRGLYVSMKTASAFQVRETEHGRSSLEFDYRIVARPSDAKNDRLPPVPSMPKPRLSQRVH
ncbi:MAG: hypothetical protein ABSF08_07995 [Candidatus Cybelea sp.]|jgi:hypothetical protein